MQLFGQQLTGKRFIGAPKVFSLEERIFNSVCIISFLTMCVEVPINILINLYIPAGLCLFGAFFSAYLYYISRFKRKSSFGIQLFCCVCNIIFIVNYFFNSGIYGPNLMLFSLVFLLIICIIPKAQFKIWAVINVVSVFGILVVEYLYPQSAPIAYDSALSKSLDFGITYFVVVLLTYFAISYIRKNYDLEKEAVMERNLAIEQQKKELERLNSEKDKLFSIVTHDIRMPLSSIQGYLELLTEMELPDGERLKLKKQLLEITRDTSVMLTNVLSWSRTQLEGSRVVLQRINVSQVIQETLNIEKNIAKQKGVTLAICCDEDLHILADENMLPLVIRNLVNNAIKFTPKGGLVEVKACKLDQKCCITVKDNGLGVDPANRKKLFQLNAASTYGTNNEKGIGLGLLLCKEFTNLQHGEIWFESNLDQGSTFFLSFQLMDV